MTMETEKTVEETKIEEVKETPAESNSSKEEPYDMDKELEENDGKPAE